MPGVNKRNVSLRIAEEPSPGGSDREQRRHPCTHLHVLLRDEHALEPLLVRLPKQRDRLLQNAQAPDHFLPGQALGHGGGGSSTGRSAAWALAAAVCGPHIGRLVPSLLPQLGLLNRGDKGAGHRGSGCRVPSGGGVEAATHGSAGLVAGKHLLLALQSLFLSQLGEPQLLDFRALDIFLALELLLCRLALRCHELLELVHRHRRSVARWRQMPGGQPIQVADLLRVWARRMCSQQRYTLQWLAKPWGPATDAWLASSGAAWQAPRLFSSCGHDETLAYAASR